MARKPGPSPQQGQKRKADTASFATMQTIGGGQIGQVPAANSPDFAASGGDASGEVTDLGGKEGERVGKKRKTEP